MDIKTKVYLTDFYEKKSAKGHRYFTGRLGYSAVVLLQDKKADSKNPKWRLFAQETPLKKS